MNKPLVSIAIPAYKSTFLSEAIRSALNQDYTNLELIVVDDCSPDDIKDIVNNFRDPRITYIRNTVNLGHDSVAHNWNKCLELAKGDFFILLCDDDLLFPNMVSTMLGLAQAHPECGMFHANRCIRKKSGELITDDRWPIEESAHEFIDNKFAGKRKHTITEFFYRTDVLKQEKYAIFPVGYYSDDATILQLCIRQEKMISSDEPLVVFRESDIHITGCDQYAEGKTRAFIQYYQFLQNHPLLTDRISPNGYECILSQYLTHCDKKTIVRLIPSLPLSRTMLRTILYLLLKR